MHKNARPYGKRKRGRHKKGGGQQLQNKEHPTLTLKGKFIIQTTVQPNTSKRIDIAPLLSQFGA